jgi:hypothetical protein
MARCTACAALPAAVAALFLLFAGSTPARADMYLTVEVLESYNDNVVGLTADNRTGSISGTGGSIISPSAPGGAGSRGGLPGTGSGGTSDGTSGSTGTPTITDEGDFSTNLYAKIGYEGGLGRALAAFAEGSVDYARYNTYSDFNYTIATAGAGLLWRSADWFSAKITARAKTKDYGNDLRDGNAYGGALSFRERFSPLFWSRQFYEVEQNNADSADYTYFGQTAGIDLGFDVTDSSTLIAGYSYALRDYNGAEPFIKVTSQIASLVWLTDITRSWGISAIYEHEWDDSTVPGTAVASNIYTLGLRYSY